MHLAKSHTLFTAILACFCTKKEVILHPERLSYTLSYTRKRLQIQDVWGMGVGNVGFYSKTFFVERGREKLHIAPEVTKHRTSLGKSTDVLHRKYGCLPQRSPMFLFSEREVDRESLFWKKKTHPQWRALNTEKQELVMLHPTGTHYVLDAQPRV